MTGLDEFDHEYLSTCVCPETNFDHQRTGIHLHKPDASWISNSDLIGLPDYNGAK